MPSGLADALAWVFALLLVVAEVWLLLHAGRWLGRRWHGRSRWRIAVEGLAVLLAGVLLGWAAAIVP